MSFKRLTKIINNKTSYIFTPRQYETGERVKLWVEESSTPRGRITRFSVTDAKTGKKYKARTAGCGLPDCICDAVIYGYKKADTQVFDTDPEFSELKKEKRNLKRAIKGLTEVR